MYVPIEKIFFSMSHYHMHPSSVIVFGGKKQMEIQDIFSDVLHSKDIIDAVVLTGKDPTDYPSALISLCILFKQEGLLLKLVTHGNNSNLIKEIINKGLIDVLSVVVYAPLDSISLWEWFAKKPEAHVFHIYQALEHASKSNLEIEVVVPLVDGINNRADIIEEIAESVSKYEPIFVLTESEDRIPRSELHRLAKHVKGIISEVRVRTEDYGEERA